jgi:predicted DNA-binding transcriptional regulator AlpA
MRRKSKQQKSKQTLAPSALPSGNAPKPPDELVVDKQARKECGGVSRMTFNRWEKDPKLQFPPAVKINKRNYRWRSQLEEFKQKLRAKGRLS